MVYEYPDYFVVGREKVREYAARHQGRRPGALRRGGRRRARPRRAGRAADLRLDARAADPAGLLPQGRRRLRDHADRAGRPEVPLPPADAWSATRLCGRMEVVSVDERFGADIVVTRNVCPRRRTGELVLEAFTTLMGHEGDNSISVKCDPETGQVVRTAADPAKADPEAGRQRRSKAGLVTRTWPDVHSDLGVFPIKRAVRRFADRPIGERANCVSPGRDGACQQCHPSKGRSSTGRAAVSKTAGCRFKSCRPCSTEYSTSVDTGR